VPGDQYIIVNKHWCIVSGGVEGQINRETNMSHCCFSVPCSSYFGMESNPDLRRRITKTTEQLYENCS